MQNKVLNVLLIPGHGKESVGKMSPDGNFREWQFARHVVAGIMSKLEGNPNFKCWNLVPEDDDITLANRVKRTNEKCSKLGVKNCILLEVHVNASGNGVQWMKANGWQCHTTRGETKSDFLAECLYDGAEQILKPKGIKIRTDNSDGDRDIENDFYVIKHSNCPAVLTENLFMDNLNNYEFLISEHGLNDIINVHIEGIKQYYKKWEKTN